MKKIRKNNSAVSHVIGFMLTFSIIAIFVVSMIITSTVIVSEKKVDAAELQAKAILDQVTSVVIDVANMKLKYPNADYVRTINLPNAVGEEYTYYIELTDNLIYLNSTTEGLFSVHSTSYNLKDLNIGVTGRINSYESGDAKIFCNGSKYVLKFDFGTFLSPVDYQNDYILFSHDSTPSVGPEWPVKYNGFLYRIPFKFLNPNNKTSKGSNITDYQTRIELNPDNFDYDHANADGSDVRFYCNNIEIPFWIERWVPGDRSYIWLRLDELDHGVSKWVYMYYGNASAESKSNGDSTFLFFDDFEETQLNTTKWTAKNNDYSIKDGYLIFDSKDCSIVTNTFTIPHNCTITTTYTSTGDNREANIFFRNYDKLNFENRAYLLKSGNFTDISTNFAIFENTASGSTKLCNSSDNYPLSEDPQKMMALMVENVYVGLRYIYFSTGSYYQYEAVNLTQCENIDLNLGGRFGLCTTQSTGDYLTKFDWISVINYHVVTQPLSYSTYSEDSYFYWWDEDSLDLINTIWYKDQTNNDLYDDFVFSTEGAPSKFFFKIRDVFYDKNDLNGYWSFEESVKTSVSADSKPTIDRSGNKNDGVIHGATWADGFFGTALSFIATNDDYVKSDNSILVTPEGTISGWIKGDLNDQIGENVYPFGLHQFCLLGPTNNKAERSGLIVRNLSEGENYVWNWYNQNIYDGNWHWYVVTWDREYVTLYIDGKQIGDPQSVIQNGANQIPIGEYRKLKAGAAWSDTWGGHTGEIDEIRIYERALSEDEIKEYYEDASNRIYSINVGLGHPRFDLTGISITSSKALNSQGLILSTLAGETKKDWFMIEADSGIIDIIIDDTELTDDFGDDGGAVDYYWNLCELTVEHGIQGVRGSKG